MPRRRKPQNPFVLWYDTAMLGLAAQQVIALRLMKLSLGGRGASSEAQRMVTEKGAAAMQAAATVMTGGDAKKVIGGYRRRVRKNARRLFRT